MASKTRSRRLHILMQSADYLLGNIAQLKRMAPVAGDVGIHAIGGGDLVSLARVSVSISSISPH